MPMPAHHAKHTIQNKLPALQVAIVGCGYWGPNLLRNFFEHPEVTVSAICDRDAEKMSPLIQRYPTVQAIDCFDTLLAMKNLDAVAIATPVDTHYALAKKALEAGKHVLLEKPMCSTARECETLIKLAAERQLTLMVDHTFIYHGAVRRIKRMLDSGELGDLLYFDSVRVNLGLFQHDINVLWDLAPHDLSMMDYLLGKTPCEVHAAGAAHTQSRLEDIAYITLKFESDLMAHCHVSWLSPVKIRQILVGGTRKMVVYDDLEPTEKIRIYDKGIEPPTDKPLSDEARYQALVKYRVGDMVSPVLDLTEALKTEIDHFVTCIQHQQTPLSDGHAGLRVVRMLEAAQQSLKTGQPQKLEPLSLPLPLPQPVSTI